MSILEWKQINIFKVLPFVENSKLKNVKGDLQCFAYNKNYKVICDNCGWIYVYQRNWDCISFQVETNHIILCCVCRNTNDILLTLSHDPDSSDISLRVYNLQKLSKKNGAVCIGFANLHTLIKSATVVEAFQLESQIYIAIGSERGEICFFKGSLNREFSNQFKTYCITNKAITSIAFKQIDSSSVIMFVSSNAGIFSFNLNDPNTFVANKTVLDIEKVKSTVGILRENNLIGSYFTVARDDAVYCFTADGRGPCYVISGEKTCLDWCGKYLIIVVKQKKAPYDLEDSYNLIIVDVISKMIVLNISFANVHSLMVENGQCLIITKSKELFLLKEKNIKTKINIFLKRNMFEDALTLIGEAEVDKSLQAKVNLIYGDYLFQKNDFEKAIEKYNKTIGHVEPYCIIKKLLDARYTKYLVLYLKCLLKSPNGTKEHYELLQSCCERVDMPEWVDNQCDNYFGNDKLMHSSSPKVYDTELKFNAFELDNYAALTEVIHDINRVSKFFESREEKEILEFFLRHQDRMDKQYPSRILKILKQLINKNKIKNPESFIVTLMPNNGNIIQFLEAVIEHNPNCNAKIYSLLLKQHLEMWKSGAETESDLLLFLEKYNTRISQENMIILCKIYGFSKGITYILEKHFNKDIYCFFVMKNSSDLNKNMFDEKISKAAFILKVLKNSNIDAEDVSKFVINFLDATSTKQNNSILQIIHHISHIKGIKVQHIKEFFSHEFLKKVSASETNQKNIEALQNTLDAHQNLCRSYSDHPIEFRNSMCDKCRQELTFPAIYFLCQHAYHKECLNQYSEKTICFICYNSPAAIFNVERQPDSSLNPSDSDKTIVNDGVEEITRIIRKGVFREPKAKAQIKVEPKPYAKSYNPFETPDDEEGDLMLDNSRDNTPSAMKNFNKLIDLRNTNPFEVSTNPFEDADD